MLCPELERSRLAEQFRGAEPFDHLVIDDFLEPGLATAVAEALEAVEVEGWSHDAHADQVNKWSQEDLRRLPPVVADVLWDFNSPTTLSFFEDVTGIRPLVADLDYLGGGVHISTTGGHLSLHADFNLHPGNGLHRRLNALLFLNRDWDPDWGGDLEIWDAGLHACRRRITPVFNRLTVFRVTDQAFHGHPDPLRCPPERRRISLALYYYTDDRPEDEKSPFHWASWQHPEA